MSIITQLNLAKVVVKPFIALAVLLTSVANAEPILDLATKPLSTVGTDIIKPNMLYVLDNSGSMSRDYMPDWVPAVANASDYIDPSFNTLAYDPAVRYDPPTYFTNTGLIDTTTYPSQTGANTARGANTSSKPNWRQVLRNAYRSADGSSNLEGSASYTVSIANEYCTNVDLKVCVKADLPTDAYPFPAPLRWCKTTAVANAEALPPAGECQGVYIAGTYDKKRYPIKPAATVTTYRATISINTVASRPGVAGITVNGQQIMRTASGTSWSTNTLASNSRNRINDCTSVATGNCTISGYSASRSGNVITIVSPNAADAGLRPILSDYSGSIGYTNTPFVSAGTATIAGGLDRVTVNITSGNNSYPYPGASVKHPNRTDCVADTVNQTCTYIEEMTNYANWYTYYRTRIQMMKTSTSIAFKDVGSDFRMGFMTINTSSTNALDFRDFSNADKKAWYDKLFSITPSGLTPLREALAKAGRIYANKYNLGGAFTDPVQYECQQNFTLLTTDGLWNSNNGVNVTGGSIPNLDNNPTERGKYEGPTAVTGQLADVSKYYRDTDLRTTALGNCTGALGTNVCSTSGTTPVLNQKQSMVTFTLGLGVDGTLAYDADYGPSEPGDFKRIYDGNLNWPVAGSDDPETIDDLWHAAVNGDGRYFSAKRTKELVDQLREAISLIKVKTGAGAAAATSTLNPVSGDNFAYVASYTTGTWTGNLEKREIDVTTGEIKKAPLACVEDVVPNVDCAAPSQIQAIGQDANGQDLYFCVTENVTDQANCTETLVGSECRVPVTPSCIGELKGQTARTIYMNNGGALSTLDIANFSSTQAYNYQDTELANNLTQASSFNAAQLTNLTGENLINFIKGDDTYELDAALVDNQIFRKRASVLGDLIDSKPSFIGKPTFNYGDSGYQAFKTATAQATRAGTVYVGSNDGMLHAFDADTLEERWAFVPSAVIPNLWKLADSNYSANHSYYVNGDVTISDICIAANCSTATASSWRTILVGGLEGGGRGYFALDITNPNSPALLWEIDPDNSDFRNLGYTFGNPIVTKRSGDNKWVVLFTSGYNNIPDNYDAFYDSTQSTLFDPDPNDTGNYYNTGDGKGYLYVVDASNGNLLQAISTGVGSVSSPSGFAKISAYAEDSEINNVATYVYGGDLDGNLWRFNIDSSVNSVVRLAQLKGNETIPLPQPITTAPELANINGNRVVFVGTGKYLEVTDLDASGYRTQSLYAIKDTAVGNETGTVINNPRSISGFVQQTIVPSTVPGESDKRVSGTTTQPNFVTGLGWFVDFPDSGERQNVASSLVLGTLLVPTTVPTSSACQPAGYGWFNFFDYKTGLAVTPSAGFVSERTSAPSVGFNIVYVDGKPKVSNVLADNPNPELVDNVPFAGTSSGFKVKRSIWREIVN
ncbi:MAG: pilus assembly protein [Methylotenera sp.]